MDKTDLFDAVKKLATARRTLFTAKVAEANALADLKKMPAYTAHQEANKLRKAAEGDEETFTKTVRELALKLAATTDERKFVGVTVTEGDAVSCNMDKVKDYCIKRGLANFLNVDAAAFNKWLLTNAAQGAAVIQAMGLDELEVKYTDKNLKTQIAGDLDKAIEVYLLEQGSVSDSEAAQ